MRNSKNSKYKNNLVVYKEKFLKKSAQWILSRSLSEKTYYFILSLEQTSWEIFSRKLHVSKFTFSPN